MISAKQIQAAKTDALGRLHNFGITDKFVVRVKEMKSDHWVAMYRAMTQFTGQGRGPIFWVSGHLDEVLSQMLAEDGAACTDADVHEELVGSMLHEYGHVVAEWAYARSPTLGAMLSQTWPGEFHGRPWDEEEFAEDFSRFLTGRFVYQPDALAEVVAAYAAEVFEPES